MGRCSRVVSLTQLGLILTISLLPIVYFSFSLPTIPRPFESSCLTDPGSKVDMSLYEFINEHKRRHHEESFRAHWHRHYADHGKAPTDHKHHGNETSDDQGTSGHRPHEAGGDGPSPDVHQPRREWRWRRGPWGAAADGPHPDRHELRGR
jgi:hypothetical protein